jgi:uncharacterized delta-60 repeat protein
MKKLLISAQLSLLILTFISSIYAAGELDPTFNAATYINQNTGATVVQAQPDGKILIGGFFTVINGSARHGLARLNADGTLDGNFNPPDFFDPTLAQLGGTVSAIEFQSNGKILVGGRFSIFGSTYRNLVRLNTDGSLDTTFNNLSAQLPAATNIIRISVLPDNSFFALGESSQVILKFDANGVPATGFQYGGTGGFIRELAAQPDGRFYVSDVGVARQSANGSLDGTFPIPSTNGFVSELKVLPDGKILIGGAFTTVSGFAYGRLARLNTDGSVDLTFNTNNIGANGQINDIELSPDGKIFIGGVFTQYNGVAKNKIAKLNSDGTLDTSFTYTPPVNAVVLDLDLLPNGKLAVAGNTLGTTLLPTSAVVLNTDGSPDANFAVITAKQGRVRKVQQQSDGKVLIVGEFPLVNGVARNSLARLNADGTLDTGFVPYFNSLAINQTILALGAQPDGKVIVGSYQGIVLRRLNADGSQDTSFTTTLHSSSVIYDLQILPNGQILIGGTFSFIGETNFSRKVARLNADGSVDATFNTAAFNGDVYKVLQQTDGKVLIGGTFNQIGSSIRGRFARLNTDGSLDGTFNPPGGANDFVADLDVQTDGKVVIGGNFTQLNGSGAQQRIGRLNADGTLDTTFAQTANQTVNAVKIQPDGKILIGGIFSLVGSTARSAIARLTSGGALDFTFNASATATVLDITLQTDNKILLGGEFTEINNVSRVTVARLLNATAPLKTLFDYDGDAKADVSVFRPSTNRWYLFRSIDGAVTEQTFGVAGDVASPADFDGDGKTDIGIFRPSSGDWWYLSSISGQQINVHWGQSGDIPRPSDFDADGKADYVVFRPSNNTWYRLGSAGTVSIVNFGLAGDKPVTGDFDGDGKSDVAIYRPSTGDWWYQASTNNAQLAYRWGISTDIPAPADYDGDGRTDFAVYRPSTGIWYITNSSNGSSTIVNFGISEDKPVAADYDGDGKADIAVFRPSTGTWYLLRSTAGFTALQFGVSTDIPTENSFVP